MTAELCFIGITLAISLLLLRSFGFRGAPVFAALSLAVLFSRLPAYFSEATELLSLLSPLGGAGCDIVKIIGVSYLFGISGELCRELGETGISGALTLLGRFEILAISLPYMGKLIRLALSLSL